MADVVQVWDDQEFGDNIVGTLYDDGLLELTGSGAIRDFSSTGSPVYQDVRIVSLVIEDGITAIGNYTFNGCSNLTTISLPNSIKDMKTGCFSNCSVTAFTPPTSLEAMWQDVFRNNDLQELTISHNFIMSGGTFRNNPFTIGVHVDASLTDTGWGTPFRDCDLGDRLTFGSGVTTIPYSFAANVGLTGIVFPESLTTIGAYAFEENLFTELNFPDSLTTLGSRSFQGCGNLQTIDWPNNNNFTLIPDECFMLCTSLKTLAIPDSVTIIDWTAFYYCTDLETVIIPDSVAEIRGWAFHSCYLLGTIENHYDGQQTIGTVAFLDAGRDVSPKTAYCYAANTNFAAAVEEESYVIEYFGEGGMSLDAPVLGVAAGVFLPTITAKEYIPVTGVSLHPTHAVIDEGDLLIISAIVEPNNATYKKVFWSSSNTDVASVSANGVVHGISEGTASITAETEDGGFTAVCEVVVEEYTPVVYESLKIYQKDLSTVDHTINNNEISSLVIDKELGGNCSLAVDLPYNSDAVIHITPGKYVHCEDQFYMLQSIDMGRGPDGNPLLKIGATHIFFELENLQARKNVARYATILEFLAELLSQYGVVVTGSLSNHPLYSTVRYVEYEAGNTVMDCIKTIFMPYFATFRLDNLKLVVIPDAGELPDPGQAVEFEYAVNNQSIIKSTDYSDIITKLIAEGDDDLEYTVHAPPEIKNLYRMERERTVSFSGVSVQADLEFLANRYLSYKQLPHINYRLSVAELRHISNIDSIYPGKNFEIHLGQKVKVKDTEFGVDVESVIQRYSYRPLEKWEASQVVVGDLKPYDITFMEPKSDKGVPGVGGSGVGGSGVGGSGGGGFQPAPDETGICQALHGIISTEEPPDPEEDETEYEEDCLWFKY